jgi:hypothetical protein
MRSTNQVISYEVIIRNNDVNNNKGEREED